MPQPRETRLAGAKWANRVKALHGVALVSVARPVRLALPTLVATPPTGDEWIHEVKVDGFRISAQISDGVVRCISRQGIDWTRDLPVIEKHLLALGLRDAVLDGELVAVNEHGRDDFHLLQSLARRGDPRAPLRYVAFDLMRIDRWSLVDVPLIERKSILEQVTRGSPIAFSTHHRGQGRELFTAAKTSGAEGLVSKRADSPYPSGRTRLWVKTIANRRRRRRGPDDEGS